MVSVSEERVSGIYTHFRKYNIGGIDTFGIVSPTATDKALIRVVISRQAVTVELPSRLYSENSDSLCDSETFMK